MSTEEKYARITITLPPDLAQWVRKKEADLNAQDRRMRTSVSAIIADAIEEMMRNEGQQISFAETEGKTPAAPQLSAATSNILNPSAGGSSPRRYPTKKTASRRKS